METRKYDDIIDLPHHVSPDRPHMSMTDRAAQFSPFAALTGYGDAITEAGRRTDAEIMLDESRKEALDERLQLLRESLAERPTVRITFFRPDAKKDGGAYETVTGIVKKFDAPRRCIVMENGAAIPVDRVYEVEGELFRTLDFDENNQ